MDDATIEKALFPDRKQAQPSHAIDFEYIRKELLRNGVTKKPLWAEYCESCRLCNREPLMYSQFCCQLPNYGEAPGRFSPDFRHT